MIRAFVNFIYSSVMLYFVLVPIVYNDTTGWNPIPSPFHYDDVSFYTPIKLASFYTFLSCCHWSSSFRRLSLDFFLFYPLQSSDKESGESSHMVYKYLRGTCLRGLSLLQASYLLQSSSGLGVFVSVCVTSCTLVKGIFYADFRSL